MTLGDFRTQWMGSCHYTFKSWHETKVKLVFSPLLCRLSEWNTSGTRTNV